jgi:CDP-paratose 2-epimerase
MPTCCLRGGCLTGPNHAAVPLHGFLSYLVKCNLERREYSVLGYKGKQVRDTIHSYDAPFSRRLSWWRNIAALHSVTRMSTRRGSATTSAITATFRMKAHYPSWSIRKTPEQAISEIVDSWHRRLIAEGQIA